MHEGFAAAAPIPAGVRRGDPPGTVGPARGAAALLGDRLRDLRLFGSEARGEPHEESDIDLLVLVDGLDEETWRAVIDLASSISPLAPLTGDFERYHSPRQRATGIYQEIRRESVRL